VLLLLPGNHGKAVFDYLRYSIHPVSLTKKNYEVATKETWCVGKRGGIGSFMGSALGVRSRKQQWSIIGWVTKYLLSRAPLCFGSVKPLVPIVFVVISTHQSALGPHVGPSAD
jgi:hypothetical protein